MNKIVSLRPYPFSVGVGTKEVFAVSGRTIRLISANVPITFESSDGLIYFTLVAGEEAVFDEAIFYRLYVSHADPAIQLITIAVGNGGKIGSVKIAGSVSITGGVALDAPTLAALESIDLNAATLNQLRFESYGASYRSTTSLAANTPETVFTPAANINGAIIHSAQFLHFDAAGVALPAYLSKASAPASVIDGDAILSTDCYAPFTGQNSHFGSLKRPLRISAGKGLYFISNILQSAASRSVLYTLL